MSQMSIVAKKRDGLRFLSLDAGGVRGISQVKIIAELMHRLNFDAPSETHKLPSDIFDMISGVGTGGFIAILFSVFGLSTDQALEEFVELSVTILDQQSISATERTAALRQYISRLLAKYKIAEEAKLLDPNSSSKDCKLVVPIAYKYHVGSPCILRNFNSRQEQTMNLTIKEAIVATLATPPLFTSISISKDATTFQYIGGDIMLSNPSTEMITEAYDAFGSSGLVACLLNVGCGNLGVISAPEGTDNAKWNQFLESIVMDSGQKAQNLESRMGHLGLYHRFHVLQGLEKDLQSTILSPGDIISHTSVYLTDVSISRKLELCVDSLKLCDGLASLDQLKRSGGQRVLPPTLPPLTRTFVMRKEPWKFVEKALLGLNSLERRDEQNILVVTGIGGCGKTQLMLKFLRVHSSKFASSHFIDGSSEPKIRADTIRHVRSLETKNSQMTFDECIQFLSQTVPNGQRIILYDNVDDPNLDILPLIPNGDGCAVVITSRNRSMGSISPGAHLELDKMSIDEAVDLLLYSSNPSRSNTEQNHEDARAIAENLDYLPIALQQARSYMSETGCSSRSYLERLIASRDKLMAHPVKYQRQIQNLSTYTAFDASFGKLDQRPQKLISLLSFLHWSNFPIELVTLAAKNDFYEFENEYVEQGDDNHEGVCLLKEIFAPGNVWDPTNLDVLISSLQNYSLITLVHGIDTMLIEMHPLLHTWVQSHISTQDNPAYQSAAIVLLAIGSRSDYTPSGQYLPGHVMHMSPVWNTLSVNEAAAFAMILRDGGLYEGALQLQEEVVVELRQQLSPNSSALSKSLWLLATIYQQFGRLDEALILQQEVLELRKEILGEGHPDTIVASSDLAITYSDLGRFDDALVLREEALRVRKELLGLHHPDTIMASSNLAVTYSDLGWLDKALVLDEEVLRLRKELLGERHPDTIAASNNLAVTYSDLGRLDEALVIREEVLRLRKERLGERHPDTLVASSNLAITYSDLGRLEEALALREEVLKLRREILGERHPDTISASNDLAVTYSDLGRFDEALVLREEVLRLRREILGERHPDTISASNNLANTYCDLGRHEETLVLREEVLKLRIEILGKQHPNTCKAMLNLAETYIIFNKESAGLDLIRTAETTITETLGTEHPLYKRCQETKARLKDNLYPTRRKVKKFVRKLKKPFS